MINFLVDKIGASVCHQLPARSLQIGDIILPVCARCSGIYIGFFISAIVLFILFRKRENGLPPLYIIVILALFLISTISDGIISNFASFNTNNTIRFITGYLCGIAMITIIYPIFNFQYFKESNDTAIFSRPIKFIVYILVSAAFISIVLLRINFLGYFFYYFNAFSIVFTFFFINLLIVLLIPLLSQKAANLLSKYLAAPLIISIALSVLELFISYRLHQFLLNLGA
ncbi:MAG: DUF2085 domain-containing protein [Actinobacteria bacterium]|nr:DUF2085 domain-containing protein [Actinomycetota bacterium]